MTLLPGTRVWYRTYRYRNDARFRYSLSPNDDLRPMESVPPAEFAGRFKTVIADPLNPHTAKYAPVPMSELSLPGAPPQTWLDRSSRPVPKGTVEQRPFHSKLLGNETTYKVYTPAGLNARLPLLILFDGESYARELRAPETLDNLIHEGRIRPVLAVMLNHAQGRRTSELTCNPAFVKMLVTELIPEVRAQYPIADEPVTVGGASYGGLAAAFAALEYPDVFGGVISQSGSFWWKPQASADWQWLIDQYARAAPAQTRYFLEVGLMETGTPGGRPSMLASNRRMRDVLRARNCKMAYSEFNGDHSDLNWRGSFADALIFTFGSRQGS